RRGRVHRVGSAVLELARAGVQDVVLDRLAGGARLARDAGADDREPRGLVREVRLVVLVAERLAQVDHAQDQDEDDGHDESELNESLALLLSETSAYHETGPWEAPPAHASEG